MTTTAALARPAAPAAAAAGSGRAARVGEFLAVGGATFLLFPLAWLLRRGLGLEPAELAVGFLAFHAASVINDPHFAVTYLLFYRNAKRRALGRVFDPVQRARYVVAGFLVPLGLAAWAGAALWERSAEAMGSLMQLMFLLVGWHYVKQGFGVLTVLSARRGTLFVPLERKVILLHCYAAWAHAWASPADPGRRVVEQGVVHSSWVRPPELELATGIVFGLSALALGWVLVRKRRTEGRWPPLSPVAVFLATVWLWTVYSSLDPLMVYVIPALHGLQYLYFVWLLRRNQAREGEGPPSFGRPASHQLAILAASAVAVGWVLFRGAPGLLDGALVLRDTDDPLGDTPYLAALFAFVNIHHYFMDHVIWRRENPETRYLRG